MSVSRNERIVTLLAEGVPATVVAAATGVSDGFISQLQDEPEIAQAIALKKAARVEEELEREGQVKRIENAALDRIEKMIPFAKLETAATVFEKMNKARRNVLRDPNSDSESVGQVVLVLPAAAQTMIQLNPQNQVIAVDSRSIAPLPSKALPALAKEVATNGQSTSHGKHQGSSNAAVQLLAQREARDVSTADAILERASRDIPILLNGVPAVI